jgi:hypothetical protein
MGFKAESIGFDLMDAGKRLANLAPVAGGAFNGLDGFKNQDASAGNRDNPNGSGDQDTCSFRKEAQPGKLDLELLHPVGRSTEFGENRI